MNIKRELLQHFAHTIVLFRANIVQKIEEIQKCLIQVKIFKEDSSVTFNLSLIFNIDLGNAKGHWKVNKLAKPSPRKSWPWITFTSVVPHQDASETAVTAQEEKAELQELSKNLLTASILKVQYGIWLETSISRCFYLMFGRHL